MFTTAMKPHSPQLSSSNAIVSFRLLFSYPVFFDGCFRSRIGLLPRSRGGRQGMVKAKIVLYQEATSSVRALCIKWKVSIKVKQKQ